MTHGTSRDATHEIFINPRALVGSAATGKTLSYGMSGLRVAMVKGSLMRTTILDLSRSLIMPILAVRSWVGTDPSLNVCTKMTWNGGENGEGVVGM
jgi:hypothetical protein